MRQKLEDFFFGTKNNFSSLSSVPPGDSKPTDFTTEDDILIRSGRGVNYQGTIAPEITNLYVKYQQGKLDDKSFLRGTPDSIVRGSLAEGIKIVLLDAKGENGKIHALKEAESNVTSFKIPTFFLGYKPFLSRLLSKTDHVIVESPTHVGNDQQGFLNYPPIVALGKDRGNPGGCYFFDVRRKSGAELTGDCDQVLNEFSRAVSEEQDRFSLSRISFGGLAKANS